MNSLEYLFGLELHGIKLGLETIRHILQRCGNPESACPTVHVGGTNGKGSVTAFLAAMLRKSGYRVGRFTSPHLCHISERFLINGEPIPPARLNTLIERVRAVTEALPQPPTFFEVNTAIAFLYFAEENVDLAIIEVGMGGRFDSTNVITPRLSVITNIALEHTAFLGDTLEAIAFEKAGIIKPGVPLILGEQQQAPLDVIEAKARNCEAPVLRLGPDFTFTWNESPAGHRWSFSPGDDDLANVTLGLPGAYQGANAALAVQCATRLATEFPRLTPPHMRAGLESAQWPCRMEQVLHTPPVIVDVAHNAAGMDVLVQSLARPCLMLLAVAADKNARAMAQSASAISNPLLFTQFEGRRALPVQSLVEAAGDLPHLTFPTLPEAIEYGLAHANPDLPLVIAGSIFTAGEARTYLIDHHNAKPLRF